MADIEDIAGPNDKDALMCPGAVARLSRESYWLYNHSAPRLREGGFLLRDGDESIGAHFKTRTRDVAVSE